MNNDADSFGCGCAAGLLTVLIAVPIFSWLASHVTVIWPLVIR